MVTRMMATRMMFARMMFARSIPQANSPADKLFCLRQIAALLLGSQSNDGQKDNRRQSDPNHIGNPIIQAHIAAWNVLLQPFVAAGINTHHWENDKRCQNQSIPKLKQADTCSESQTEVEPKMQNFVQMRNFPWLFGYGQGNVRHHKSDQKDQNDEPNQFFASNQIAPIEREFETKDPR